MSQIEITEFSLEIKYNTISKSDFTKTSTNHGIDFFFEDSNQNLITINLNNYYNDYKMYYEFSNKNQEKIFSQNFYLNNKIYNNIYQFLDSHHFLYNIYSKSSSTKEIKYNVVNKETQRIMIEKPSTPGINKSNQVWLTRIPNGNQITFQFQNTLNTNKIDIIALLNYTVKNLNNLKGGKNKKSPSKKTLPKKSPSKKSAYKKSPSKKRPSKKSPSKKQPSKK